ncbi:hypothetical protein [Dysgonomonas sp. ZJ709]|uniref:hypothetical protein n=1 Tax=Dysgonomonas sp. ZJ709 TaxID=2709797 RepID=UPI0013ED8CCD|nr:hypothetical protein [Dysgonomonas sp. ZJ709]
MGKDHSGDTYKKSYEKEYLKSYENSRTQKKLYDDLRKDYETVSKKLDDKPYPKSEKGEFKGIVPASAEYVNPEGRPSKIEKRATPLSDARAIAIETRKQAAASEKPSKQPIQTISKKPQSEVPPPYVPPFQKEKQYAEADYSYIDKNSLEAPVQRISDKKYKDIYTEEVIDDVEARKRLLYAGYVAKEKMNFGMLVVLSVVALFLNIGGPVFLMIIGICTMTKKDTVLEKVKNSGWKLSFSMPATPSEQDKYKSKGVLYIAIGIIIGIYQSSLSYGTIASLIS